MRTFFTAIVLGALLQAQGAQAQVAPKGDPQSGAQQWRSKLCADCHGEHGEGGFGPDLAGGRGLTWDQFRHTIRKPWGVMLAYTEQQLPDQKVADVFAFVQAQPKVAEPGHWHWAPVPSTAPLGQRVYMNTIGCGQCHEPENKFARMWLGEHAKEVNFEYFAKLIYNHTDKYPTGGMGNYSKERLPEFVLREVYKFLVEDLGLRASIGGAILIGESAGGNTTYNLTVTNRGVKGVGLDAEDLTVFVKVPAGAKVVSGSGPGYAGAKALASLGLEPGLQMAPHPNAEGVFERPKQDLSADAVVWRVPKLPAGDKVALSFVLTGTPTPESVKGFDGSTVYWGKPGRNAYGMKLAYRDLRTPDKGDHERLGLPRLPAPPSQ